MIVALEGLSCAGKTATSTALSLAHPELYVAVPEFVLPLPENITTEFCKENDLVKMERAQNLSVTDGRTVLMDRSFLSTCVYVHAAQEEGQQELVQWYNARHESGEMQLPDMFVYLRINPAVALQRALHTGRHSENIAWYTGVDAAVQKYDTVFSSPNLSSIMSTVDANGDFMRVAIDTHMLIAQRQENT